MRALWASMVAMGTMANYGQLRLGYGFPDVPIAAQAHSTSPQPEVSRDGMIQERESGRAKESNEYFIGIFLVRDDNGCALASLRLVATIRPFGNSRGRVSFTCFR
jgi:hypothetical protein